MLNYVLTIAPLISTQIGSLIIHKNHMIYGFSQDPNPIPH